MQTQEMELDSVRKSVRQHYGKTASRGRAPMLDSVIKSLRARSGKGAVRGGGCGCGAVSGSPGEQAQPSDAAIASLR